ncbi:DUF2510 domain-containing protein [Rhodococcus sp. NPDC057135]|uniref:DUF2510 domain-containing protein n=1 Tax=Rhodococcus sp. NPDC057135 TaxID=3346028 RepID=UPI00362E40CD
MHWLIVFFVFIVVAVGIVALVLVLVRSSSARTTPAAEQIVQGWYPDAMDPRFVRWFDGRVWTDQVRPR